MDIHRTPVFPPLSYLIYRWFLSPGLYSRYHTPKGKTTIHQLTCYWRTILFCYVTIIKEWTLWLSREPNQRNDVKRENTKIHQDGFFFTSSHSVDRYQIHKYPYCHISNTPLFSWVLRCYSRDISAARMEWRDGFFSTTYHSHFWWNIWIFHAQETHKSTTPNTPRVELWYPDHPMTARISSQGRDFNEQKLWVMSPSTSLAGNIVQRASPTNPQHFCKKNQNTTIKWTMPQLPNNVQCHPTIADNERRSPFRMRATVAAAGNTSERHCIPRGWMTTMTRGRKPSCRNNDDVMTMRAMS